MGDADREGSQTQQFLAVQEHCKVTEVNQFDLIGGGGVLFVVLKKNIEVELISDAALEMGF